MSLKLQQISSSLEAKGKTPEIVGEFQEYRNKIFDILENKNFIPYKKHILSILKIKNLSRDEEMELNLGSKFGIGINKLLEMIKQDRIDEAFEKIIYYLKVQEIFDNLNANGIKLNQYISKPYTLKNNYQKAIAV